MLQNEPVTTFESISKLERNISIHYTDNILNDAIIYNNARKPLKNLGTYKENLKRKADKVINLLISADKLKQGDADLKDLFDRINQAIIERATERLFEQQSFELVRENIDKELEASYFNIDALYDKMEAYCKYYSYKEGLYNRIKAHREMYHTIQFYDSSEMENENDNSKAEEKCYKEEQKEKIKARLQQKIESVRDELINYNREHKVDEYYLLIILIQKKFTL